MASRRTGRRPGAGAGRRLALLLAAVTLVPPLLAAGAAAAPLAADGDDPACRPGARTLEAPGSVLYPETGNGGYRSVRSDVRLVYDASDNRFLRGTHVVLTLQATHCLSELSLDFERRDVTDRPGGPRLRVDGVRIDGQPAAHRFARPTYPGNPLGPDDPDPRAHQASQTDPVGGPDDNPLPPACSPSLSQWQGPHARTGTLCPATKLVITPDSPVPAGTRVQVRVDYSGHPGVHRNGNSGREGWFRTRGGNSMVTEPVGSQAWMPLNNHPSVKVPYTFEVRTDRGKTVIANGTRSWVHTHRPDRRFPRGSATTRWVAPDPMASYLPVVLIGDYRMTRRRVGGITYHLAQDRHIGRERQGRNARVMRLLPGSTRYLQRFNGAFPFRSNGVVAARAGTDVMEMQTMIVFTGGRVDRTTLHHENMHQWWGDHVGQDGYRMVFFKEGLATLGEMLVRAIRAERQGDRGGFRRAMTGQFDRIYHRPDRFWRRAPSRPSAATYFGGPGTYVRPGAAYVALSRILGDRRFAGVLQGIQRDHGDGTISQPELEAAFADGLRDDGPACRRRLDRFFDQWFDTAYRDGGKPRITGPGLAGRDFFTRACPR